MLNIAFYLEVKKKESDMTKFPLCIDIVEEPMSLLREFMPTLIETRLLVLKEYLGTICKS